MKVAHLVFVLFASVFIDMLGLPVPSFPVLVVTGSFASSHGVGFLASVAAAALVACEIADSIWYVAGRRYGHLLTRMICRISIEPETCIRKNQKLYARIGPRVLLVSKFLPGVGALSTLYAGAVRTPYRRFLLFDVGGSLLWIGAALAIGVIFQNSVLAMFRRIQHYIGICLLGLLVIFVSYIVWKWWRRHAILQISGRVRRISIENLKTMQSGKPAPMLVDARARISKLPDVSEHSAVVVYCACPDEISSALLAARFEAEGVSEVFVLKGGVEALRLTPSPNTEHPELENQASK